MSDTPFGGGREQGDRMNDIDKEWELAQSAWEWRLEKFSVSMQLFCEQAKEKGFGSELEETE